METYPQLPIRNRLELHAAMQRNEDEMEMNYRKKYIRTLRFLSTLNGGFFIFII
ncbi:hypothetical protein P4S95_02920 [Aneurinibacillus aneurinilyticus]|jgi:hypothetical protein|uniref:hypothetical protein n=1 Tax=Aneurinibacillus aneurinilyticus TaxID=1391 RepID=UPI0004206B12|nr:hypothetical protein [Aneurinibacillus aneurinilyticus]